VSVARCARVSYLTHAGVRNIGADIELYNRLISSGHMSPAEHCAVVATPAEVLQHADHQWCPQLGTFVPKTIGNFAVPFLQHRKQIERLSK